VRLRSKRGAPRGRCQYWRKGRGDFSRRRSKIDATIYSRRRSKNDATSYSRRRSKNDHYLQQKAELPGRQVRSRPKDVRARHERERHAEADMFASSSVNS